jgi:class 3 adenylate cyclase
MHPDRCTKLALWAPKLRFVAEEGLPGGIPTEHLDDVLGLLTERWGTGITAHTIIPSADDDVSLQWWAKLERHSLSPGSVAPLLRMVAASDVRAVLGAVSVPTLVVHRREDRYAPIEHGRLVAAAIRDARLVELDGCDHAAWVGDWEPYFDAVEEHLTGAAHTVAADRVLATVMFTDIVGSTERAAEGGDKRWTRRLTQHDAVVGDQLTRHRGELVKSTGDGVLAMFDGPTRAVECASAIVREARTLGLELRAGVHTGEIERRGDDIAGLSVHVAARLEALAEPGTVVVSQTVVDLVAGSGLAFRSAGERALKGVPGRWRVHVLSEGTDRGVFGTMLR